MRPFIESQTDSLPGWQKWQRRFFLLYEHGLLRYALDDMSKFRLSWLSILPEAAVDVIEIKLLVQLFSLGEFTACRVCARPLEPVA
ncbi:hypothetical protein SRHO_G00048920 [Serrasalmus rhombeus]